MAPNQAVLDFGEIRPWGLVVGFWIGFDFGFRICQVDFGAILNQFSAYAMDFGLAFVWINYIRYILAGA